MTYYWIFEFLFPACYGILGLGLAAVALRSYRQQFKYLVPWKVAVGLLAVGLLPVFAHCARQISAPPWFGIDTIVLSAIGILLISAGIMVLWYRFSGFIIPGHSSSAIRDAFLARAAEKGTELEAGDNSIPLANGTKIRFLGARVLPLCAVYFSPREEEPLMKVMFKEVLANSESSANKIYSLGAQLLLALSFASLGLISWLYTTSYLLP